jgi:hypothetical protein
VGEVEVPAPSGLLPAEDAGRRVERFFAVHLDPEAT